MIKVNYNETTGEILGYYPNDFGYETIPEPFIEIAEEEHSDCINNQGYRKIDLETKKIITCEVVPPTKTKEDKLNALSFKYQETIENLSKAVGVATLRNNATQIENLKKTYNEQTLKYKQEREVIVNG